MTPERRIGAYARLPGRADLVGGVIAHGEHPRSAVVRLIADQAGLAVAVRGVLSIQAHVQATAHEDQVLFEVEVVGPLTDPPPSPPAHVGVVRRQRFAAYGMVTDPAGRMLLSRIAPGFPGAGKWHLPGGGTDFGEQPDAGLLREVYEESGQHGEVDRLLGITHRRNPAALGPEGYPIDWHAVRALYRVLVPVPTQPWVTETAGGSTADAAWFAPEDVSGLTVTDVVRWVRSHNNQANDEYHFTDH